MKSITKLIIICIKNCKVIKNISIKSVNLCILKNKKISKKQKV